MPDRIERQDLERALHDAGVTGASFAYWTGTDLTAHVAGLRNSRTGDPVTKDTVMLIGSIAKLFTATLMMQLVDDGLIALDDPVLRHLPDLRFADMDALAQVTCRMLMNHTSGFDCDILPDHGPDQERIADAVARCAGVGQLHKPGEGTSYCNLATVVAGYLVQTLRGRSWYELVTERIFQPLGMRHALAHPTDLPLFRAAVGDVTDPASGQPVQTSRPFLPLSFAPGGTTLMMSAADLVRFAVALIGDGSHPDGGRILSAASAALMREPTSSIVEYPDAHWGLGWLIWPDSILYHGGGGPGVVSVLYAHPPSGRAVALLTNSDRWGALDETIIQPLLRAWTGTATADAEPAALQGRAEAYAGTYENDLYRARVFEDDGQLQIEMAAKTNLYDNALMPGHKPARLTPLADGSFEVRSLMPGMTREIVRFAQPGADGRMQIFGCFLRSLVRRA